MQLVGCVCPTAPPNLLTCHAVLLLFISALCTETTLTLHADAQTHVAMTILFSLHAPKTKKKTRRDEGLCALSPARLRG